MSYECDFSTATKDQINSKNDSYSCARCEKKFVGKIILRGHLRFIHEMYEGTKANADGYDCDECGKSFSQLGLLHQHWFHHRSPQLKCTKCSAMIKTPRSLRDHLLKQHNQVEALGAHSCVECGKTFKYSFQLDAHAAFHKPPQFSCTDCGEKFFLRRNLHCHISHMHKRKKENSRQSCDYICSVCEKQLSSEKTLTRHSVLHMPRQFKCSMCEATFVASYTRDQHMNSIHSITVAKETTHKCDVCEKEFPYRKLLEFLNHKLYHGAPTKACNRCDRKFYTIGILRKHQRFNHPLKWKMPTKLSKKKPRYHCAVCCRLLPTRSQLYEHLCNHYQKPIECDICHKFYHSNDSLKQHSIRIHKLVNWQLKSSKHRNAH